MGSYFRILAAIPGFFVSALIAMLLWGVIAPQFGIDTIGYPMAMLVTITLWLTVAPLAAMGRFHFLGMLGAVPGFFLSSLFLMLLWGAIAPQFGLETIGYSTAMLITITLWLTVGPLAFAAGRATARWATWRERRQPPPGV